MISPDSISTVSDGTIFSETNSTSDEDQQALVQDQNKGNHKITVEDTVIIEDENNKHEDDIANQNSQP
jgi:hypothetical protein